MRSPRWFSSARWTNPIGKGGHNDGVDQTICCWTRPQESSGWEKNPLFHGHFLLRILRKVYIFCPYFKPIPIHNISKVRLWGLWQRRLQIRWCLANDGPELGHYTLLGHLASPEFQQLGLRLDSWGRGKPTGHRLMGPCLLPKPWMLVAHFYLLLLGKPCWRAWRVSS